MNSVRQALTYLDEVPRNSALSLITARGDFTALTRPPELGAAAYAINHDTGLIV